MKVRRFDDRQAFDGAALDLLSNKFAAASGHPHGVMLSGGSTPLPIYQKLAARAPNASNGVHVLFSDERMVHVDSPESNYANAAGMVLALGVPESRVLRVHTELPVGDAAQRYHLEITHFFEAGGRIALGLLGLGADGHTASLFTVEAVEQSRGRFAAPVPRKEGPDRVTVTADLLERIDRIVFWVTGEEKADIVQTLLDSPEAIPAGVAVAGHPNVEVWVA